MAPDGSPWAKDINKDLIKIGTTETDMVLSSSLGHVLNMSLGVSVGHPDWYGPHDSNMTLGGSLDSRPLPVSRHDRSHRHQHRPP